jgi:fluoroquinolone transport system ATP-binding protein
MAHEQTATLAQPAGVETDEVIAVDGLTFTHPMAVEPAMRGIDFAVRRGEIFGFLGPSGAGKSTTQKILTGLLTGYGGSVAVLGRQPKLTGLENLRFFASLYRRPTEDPMELLDQVGLADAAHVRVATYSKGMQMRLVVVRALLHRPEVLFLDEPTSGMDPANARKVKDIIRQFRDEGRTVLDHPRHDRRRPALRPSRLRGRRPDRGAGFADGAQGQPQGGSGDVPD